ncbi:S26 family signal peptidase [Hyphomonas sp. CY54-11-8]|uniref:S26 family signal peptidase n=1 Tax=Hyphomonas sp. CY54-11-8 TaxID=1280944 RepID=UPI0004589FBD|nr:S26 family signal peptidase [Hyphomonas sp. CY54-11-8]KCZ48476.1 hypothetical protein HY17_16635 [Hyphomonas sp. CY54-11-8]
MRQFALGAAAACLAALAAVSVCPPTHYLVWNRTESAPQGLYWRSDGPLTLNGWAVVSGKAASSKWISSHGYLARDWPVIKQVRAMAGDEICRSGLEVFINGAPAATALERDGAGRELPRWQGCVVLSTSQVFLLNGHPRSLDGRYFGATDLKDVTGGARLLLRWN